MSTIQLPESCNTVLPVEELTSNESTMSQPLLEGDQTRPPTFTSYGFLVSFPDPAFMKDKGLAHFAQNLGLPNLAGEEQSCDNKYIHNSGWGLELKRRLGQGISLCHRYSTYSAAVRY